MNTHTLLVVDDEPNITFSIRQSFESESLRVVTAGSGREAVEVARGEHPDVVLLDVRLPDMSGLDLYGRLRDLDPRVPVIIMTAFARTDTAIEATRRGAFDYLVKPVDFSRLREVVHKALEVRRLASTPAILQNDTEVIDPQDADVIVGQSPTMQEVYKAIGRVAELDAPVLILGESGTGKELVARAIYHYSRRKTHPFLAINCAALPESLLESELFGHERGAFTGADQRRIGKFEQAHGGTILLDEIGDMSPATQAKALRLLQQQQFERVGGNVTIQTDVRVIAATNRDIARMVEEGRFRRDLFYRLNTFTIELPPLRQRPEDIPLLARHFAQRHASLARGHVPTIAPEALEVLRAHSWPGNVREFASAIRYALVHGGGDAITVDSLPESCRPSLGGHSAVAGVPPREAVGNWPAHAPEPTFDLVAETRRLLALAQPGIYRTLIAEVDRVVFDLVLRRFGGNQVQAAEFLGISRQTLRSRLKALERAGTDGASEHPGEPLDEP